MTEDDNSVLENNGDAKLSPGANHHENSIQLNKGGGAKSIYSKIKSALHVSACAVLTWIWYSALGHKFSQQDTERPDV